MTSAKVEAVIDLLRATCPSVDWNIDPAWSGCFVQSDSVPAIAMIVSSVAEFDHVVAFEVLRALVVSSMAVFTLDNLATQVDNTSKVFAQIEKNVADQESKVVAGALKNNLAASQAASKALVAGWASAISAASANIAFRSRPGSSIM